MTTTPTPPPAPSGPETPGGVPPQGSPGQPSDDNTMAMLIHIFLIFLPLGSLIIWLMKKDQSPFVNHHGKQALSFFIVSAISAVVIVVLCYFCIGCFILPVYMVLHIVFPVIAAIAANKGEWYKYPVIGDIIK